MSLTRVGVPLLVVLAAATSACGSSSSEKSSPPGTTAPPATATTTTTTPEVPLSNAVWPTAASSNRYDDPVAAARAFATDYLHFVSPIVGQFQPGDARSGEVPIRASSRGPVSTVFVRRLGTDGSWWVLGSATPNIKITEPAALATITSPVTVRGTSTAFEATVQVSIRQDDNATPMEDGFVMGGASGEMEPFEGTFTFAPPVSRHGAIVLYTLSSADGNVMEATTLRVGLEPK